MWKLLYIYMLGYDVDFGVIEAVHLLAMPGYLIFSVKLLSGDQFGIGILYCCGCRSRFWMREAGTQRRRVGTSQSRCC